MNTWLFLALLASAMQTVVNFLDKYIVEGKIKDQRAVPGYLGVAALIVGTVAWIAFGRPTLGTTDAWLILGTGALSLYGLLFYFRALALDQTSIVVMLIQMTPVLTLVFAALFLGDVIGARQLFGFILILLAALGLSYERDMAGAGRLRESFLLVLLADAAIAASYVLVKFVLEESSFPAVVAYESWGMFLGGLSLYLFSKNQRQAFIVDARSIGWVALGWVLLSESIFIVSKAVVFFALSSGPAALVSAVLEGTQVVYAIVFGLVLTLILPKIFKEDISRSGLGKKAFAAIVLLCGVWLVRS